MDPIRFEPLLKRSRWGGTRLASELGKQLGSEVDYSESWEIADHGADQSVVSEGPLTGLSLQELLQGHNKAVLGRHAGRSQFPLLIKFLDANDRLSVQVHPDDAQARTFDVSENGKTEAWVIIDAQPGSRLYAGLKESVTADILRAAVADGTVEDCLHSIVVAAGDCVFIPAGTVHAISEGILLAEVQQSSDLTFRLYDWGRTGTDGKPRELHIEHALMCTDFERGPVECVVPRPIDDGEELVNCNCFTVRRYSAPGKVPVPDDDRFHVLMGISGEATLVADASSKNLKRGQTLLLPADREPFTIELSAGDTVLDIFLPHVPVL